MPETSKDEAFSTSSDPNSPLQYACRRQLGAAHALCSGVAEELWVS